MSSVRPTSMRALRLVCALGLAGATTVLGACGGSGTGTMAFSHQFADNQAETLGAVMERLPAPQAASQPQNATSAHLAVVTTQEEPRQVVAIDLDSGQPRWSFAFDAQTRPEILGDLVITSERHRVVAIDLTSGQQRWEMQLPDLAYVGADRDGGTVYLAFTVGALGGARRQGHLAAVDARTGSQRWRHEIEGVFGQPVASGGMVLVPYERQNISILDGVTGFELARLRSTDDVIAWMRHDPTGIYYGHRGVYRLTNDSVHGTRDRAVRMEPPIPSVPPLHEGEAERPVDLEDDGFLPKPGTRTARGRIRLYYAPRLPQGEETIGVLGDTYYFVYYRYVFGMNTDGSLRWARILEQDVIGAQVVEGGLLTVGEQGQMRVLGRNNGQDAWSGGSAMQLSSVALDAAGFSATPTAAEPRPLREVLNEIALDPDNRLVAARAYAVRLLAGLPDAEITRDLLDLYQQRSMPRALRESIATTLRTRTSGSEHLVAALSRRYDFIEGTEGPPLELIVPSLIEMRATQAVPGLVQQMNDHETSPTALVLVVRAVAELGDASVLPALRNFLVLYRADSSFAENAEALTWAARGIFRLGGPEGRQLLSALAADGRTVAPLTASINGFYEEERQQAERLAAQQAADAQRAADEAARQAAAALPNRLTQEQINQTFADHTEPLRACVAAEVQRNPLLGQVRLVFILTSDGHASEIGVAPSTPELVQCMTEQVAGIQFPQFRQRRQRGSFTVALRGGQPVAATSQSALEQRIPADAPWWTWWNRRAEAGASTTVGAAEGVTLAWWDHRAAPERESAASNPAPAVPEGTDLHVTTVGSGTDVGTSGGTGGTSTGDTGTDAAGAGGTPWWMGAGAGADAPEEVAPTPPPVAPPPPP
ncbi:MAG: PQQ-binding-like beta-propeller repeat protein, partial [Sandaracinaceae bacterium]|nr:PQQ-binding-like beta-propeller repeat protein [Sandaracinaceae bacterium]